MAKFYELRVNDVRRETEDCVSIAFDLPEDRTEDFSFKMGQYLTFKVKINGEELRRSYSICTSPVTDDELRIAAKKVEGGRVSGFLNNKLKIGDSLEVMPPMGNFTVKTDSSHQKRYILFAGGSGITPMMSILKTVLNTEPKSTLELYYANRNKESIIFRDELNELQLANEDRLKVNHILEEGADKPLFEGIITEEKLEEMIEAFPTIKEADEYFICGPGKMMENIESVLNKLTIEKSKIHVEHFTAVLKAIEDIIEEDSGEDVDSEVTVIMDDEEFEFNLNTSGVAILDAALEAGADAPFSCKGAVCCTCKAKVLEGKVKMNMNYALSDEEVEEGFVLACQSHPTSSKVVISFDDI